MKKPMIFVCTVLILFLLTSGTMAVYTRTVSTSGTVFVDPIATATPVPTATPTPEPTATPTPAPTATPTPTAENLTGKGLVFDSRYIRLVHVDWCDGTIKGTVDSLSLDVNNNSHEIKVYATIARPEGTTEADMQYTRQWWFSGLTVAVRGANCYGTDIAQGGNGADNNANRMLSQLQNLDIAKDATSDDIRVYFYSDTVAMPAYKAEGNTETLTTKKCYTEVGYMAKNKWKTDKYRTWAEIKLVLPAQPAATPESTATATPETTAAPTTPAATETATPAATESATPAPTETATPAPTETATPAPTETATPAASADPTETPPADPPTESPAA